MRSRRRDAQCRLAPEREEAMKIQPFLVAENGEARERGARAAIQGRRYPPYAATVAVAQLCLLLLGLFFYPVRWIGDNNLNAGIRLFGQPMQTIGAVQSIQHRSLPARSARPH